MRKIIGLWLGLSWGSLSLGLVSFEPFVNGGEKVGVSDPIAWTTVMLETDMQYCSATIVAEDTLLTAAHCFADGEPWIQIHFDGLEGKVKRKAAASVRHEQYRDVMGVEGRHDVALVFFAGGLPEGYRSATAAVSSDQIQKGDDIELAGYGNGGPLGELAKIGLRITDFLNTNSLIRFEQSSKHGICHGDSGGPAYKVIKGALTVVGIASYANEVDCSGFSVYTRVSPYTAWIAEKQKIYQQNKNYFLNTL